MSASTHAIAWKLPPVGIATVYAYEALSGNGIPPDVTIMDASGGPRMDASPAQTPTTKSPDPSPSPGGFIAGLPSAHVDRLTAKPDTLWPNADGPSMTPAAINTAPSSRRRLFE
ncbi:MAG: hypothetical protein BWY59_00184 [Verrucomicrobia bacterium ADurb.Bin345]|nr:MAG: hypothetical protein BWY59_00184 [Verrucomicrobia bacterium ADurb.Bin345]